MQVIKRDGATPEFPEYRFIGDNVDNRWFVFSKAHPDTARIMVDADFAKHIFLRLTSN